MTAEIYACVPQEFHRLIHISPLFSSTVCYFIRLTTHYLTVLQFLEGMGDMRAYVVDTIRKNGPSIFGIEGLKGTEFRTTYD